jgi:hypothetical protein
VLSLRRRPAGSRLGPGTRWSLGLATGFVSAAFALGWWLYPAYRAGLKRRLLAEGSVLARLFETKEHLAWFTLALCLGGVVSVTWGGPDGRRTGLRMLAAGGALGVTVALLGALVGAAVER